MSELTAISEGRGAGEAVLLDVGDVARLCSVSAQTVRRLHGRGEFPGAVRIGRSVRWYREEVVAWLRDRRGRRAPLVWPDQ